VGEKRGRNQERNQERKGKERKRKRIESPREVVGVLDLCAAIVGASAVRGLRYDEAGHKSGGKRNLAH
jgi:hypothetical protein